MRLYFVYIMANRSGLTYTGMTNDLRSRIIEHRTGQTPFTAKYRINRLVHLEFFEDGVAAAAREREIKGWRRSKKHALIELENPLWFDLAPGVGQRDTRTAEGRSLPGYPDSRDDS